MSNYTIKYTNYGITRKTIRDQLITTFLSETQGTGKGINASHYIYIMETFKNYEITLHRPGTLKYGFDFTVNVEKNLMFKGPKKHKTYPSYPDIINILISFRNKNTSTYNSTIKPIIVDIYNCVNVTFNSSSNLGFFTDCNNNSIPIELILLLLKWLFVEQDIRYWNYSGRDKLYLLLQTNSIV